MDLFSKYQKISIYKLYVFIKLISYNNIAKTARDLKITPFKLRNGIVSIEKSIGSELYVRNKKEFTLTLEGERFANFCRNSSKSFKFLEKENALDEDELVISTYRGIAQSILPEALIKFYSKHPKIRLVILAGIEHEEFIDPKIDVLISSPLNNRTDLQIRHLATYPYYLYASPSYLKKNGNPKNLNELSDHQIIRFKKMKYTTKSIFTEILPFIETTDYGLIYQLTKNGIGIAPIPFSRLHKNDLSDKKLVKVINGEKLTDFSVFYITRKFSSKVNLTNDLLDCIRETLLNH